MNVANTSNSDPKMVIASLTAYLDAGIGMSGVEISLDDLMQRIRSNPDTSDYSKHEKDIVNQIDALIDEHKVSECRQWKIISEGDENQRNGFYGCMIETEDNKALFAFRGSENADNAGNLINDWIAGDLALLNGVETYQQHRACKFVDSMYNKYGDRYQYSFTGHSLGGNLAEHAFITAPKGMKLGRCLNVDGPGFSDEYITAHAIQIAERANMIDHYQASLVGSLLFPLPGSNYKSIQVDEDKMEENKDKDDPFKRHSLKYMKIENGSFQSGNMDPLSSAFSIISKGLELSWTYILMSSPVLAGLWIVVQKGIPLVMELKGLAETTMKAVVSGIQAIGKAMNNWFQSMFGVHYTGEFEIDHAYINSVGSSLDQLSGRLQQISNEVEDITRSLRYNSLSGSYYKSSFNRISGQIARDREKALKLGRAAYNSGQTALKADSSAAACYSV